MGRRTIWSETVKKWAKNTGMVGAGSFFTILISFLVATGGIEILDHTGDVACAGTPDDLCVGCVTFKANDDLYIQQFGYDPWGRSELYDFDPGVKSWRMYRTWGSGKRYLNLSEPCRSTTCGWSEKQGDTKFSIVFRTGKTYTLCVEAEKHNPEDEIKWSAINGMVDPLFLPVAKLLPSVKEKEDCEYFARTDVETGIKTQSLYCTKREGVFSFNNTKISIDKDMRKLGKPHIEGNMVVVEAHIGGDNDGKCAVDGSECCVFYESTNEGMSKEFFGCTPSQEKVLMEAGA